MTADRSGVCCATPASYLVQGAGNQLTEAVVRGRLEMLPVVEVKVGGLSAA